MRQASIPTLLLLAALLPACQGLRFATEEKPLLTGHEVVVNGELPENERAIRSELEETMVPDPNRSFLGMRPTVALHNSVKEPKQRGKGLRNLLKYKIGSPPVYLEQVPLQDVVRALENRLQNRGYFAAEASYEVERKGRRASVTYTVEPGRPHRLRRIFYGDTLAHAGDTLLDLVQAERRNSILDTGSPYHLQALKDERARVIERLRNRGYIRLEDDGLDFAADTTVGDHQLDLLLRVRPDLTANERTRYRLHEVRVHGDHDPLVEVRDTLQSDSLMYLDRLGMYRPSIITRGVFLEQGDVASERRIRQTRDYLNSYGVFSGVQVELTDVPGRPGLLDVDVRSTPRSRYSLFSELNAAVKSTNFAGPGARIGWKDRDLFRGAEVLTVDLNGRFETQFAGDGVGTNAYEIGFRAALDFPRLLLFNALRTARSFVPQTHLVAGYGLFRRVGLYGLEFVNLGYGYSWRQDRFIWHEVSLPEISFNNLYYASDDFLDYLERNPQVRRSFEEQFIISLGYTWTRSTQRGAKDLDWWLLSLGADEGGNLTSLFSRALEGPRPEEGYFLFGERYSQYVRFRPEVRWSTHVGRHGAQLVYRVKAAVAKPYGNSSTIPYVKQFFSGGTNSLRAFRARSVGPGTYAPDPDSIPNNLLVDQVGDILFEANLEYRFPIGTGYLRGALFADIGNVWLINEDPDRPGGKFDWSTAPDELAMGAGFGLRFDPEVIVVRLDLATPLRRPDLPAGDRWTFDDQQPRLSDNFILNFAIGYPF